MRTALFTVPSLFAAISMFGGEPVSGSISVQGRFAEGSSWDFAMAQNGLANLVVERSGKRRTVQITPEKIATLRKLLV